MTNKVVFRLFIGLFVLIFASCVSIDLQNNKSKRASDVDYSSPKSPFSETNREFADKSWENPKNGNTISFQSICDEAGDPSLTAIRSNYISSMDDVNIKSEKKIQYNGRGAVASLINGRLDGVPIKLNLLIFKKNNCSFTLTYLGLREHFDKDIKEFERFKKRFRAR